MTYEARQRPSLIWAVVQVPDGGGEPETLALCPGCITSPAGVVADRVECSRVVAITIAEALTMRAAAMARPWLTMSTEPSSPRPGEELEGAGEPG